MTQKEIQVAYEKVLRHNEELSSRIAQADQTIATLTEEKASLERKLHRIKNNPIWKASKPLRLLFFHTIHLKNKIVGSGNPKQIAKKIVSKQKEKQIRKRYGTASFPSEQEVQWQRNTIFERPVLFSILTPVYNTPKLFLTQMIDSVRNQTYENWELCLADGSDEQHAYVGDICKEIAAKSGGKIRYLALAQNQGISGNTNECFKMARGEFIGLLDHDDILHPCALYEYAKAITNQGADYLYCDELTFKNGKIDRMQTLHFKPDYAPDNLRANNYICHFSVFARNLLEGDEVFRSRFDGSQDHDMILRLTDRAKSIVHVPKVLYYWRSHAGSVASGIEAKTYAIESARAAVAQHLTQHGFTNFVITSTRAFETIFRIQYALTDHPYVSIIIANKDHETDLHRCITSILEKSTYRNFEIVIIENNSCDATKEQQQPDIFAYYTQLLGTPYDPSQERQSNQDREEQNRSSNKITIVTYKGAFHFSAINQWGVEHSSGEVLLFLNNDTEVITPNWIEEMLMYVQRTDVGAVGAKLYYEDKSVQHAGVILGM
ncbi:MAG: glycosyltransferase, partial [Lachnospiraceae bacterium]|nr:glycosyltransferase [Lachnospiraceae bacterium]